MPEIICNTSPLQYLHQLNVLHVLRELVQTITVPPAVQQELETGHNVKSYHINIFYSDEDRGYIADIPDLEACSAFESGAGSGLTVITIFQVRRVVEPSSATSLTV